MNIFQFNNIGVLDATVPIVPVSGDLTWLTDSEEKFPVLKFDIDPDTPVTSVVQFEFDTVNTFDSGNLIQISHTLGAADLLNAEIEATIAALSDGFWYARARIDAGAWATVSQTIDILPQIISTAPVDGSTGIVITTNPSAVFNQAIQFGTGNITLRKNDGGWADVEVFNVATEVGTSPGQVNISGSTLTIYPTADFDSNKEYAIRVDATAIDDLQGNSFSGIANDTTWSFTSILVDSTNPLLSSTSPTDNATAVSVADSLTATFNEDVVFGTGLITLRKNDGGWTDVETFDVTTDVGTGAGQVSISGAVLTINPTLVLENTKEYAIRIASTAIDDLQGNSYAGIANDTTWSFTTRDWTPLEITGGTYFLWSDTSTVKKADADSSNNQTAVTTNGDSVYSWTSLGAATKSPAQITSAKRPTWHSTNGITFDGSDDILILANTLLDEALFAKSAVSVFIKGTFASSTANTIFLGEGSNTLASPLYAVFRSNTAGGEAWRPYFRNNAAANVTGAISGNGYRDGSEHVHGIVIDTTNSEVVFYKDGIAESPDSQTMPPAPASFTHFFIGGNSNQANPTGTEYMAGTVKAIVVVPAELSPTELTALHTWFAAIG